MLTIEMLPANHGDCLWIEYGEPPDTRHVVIDGGPPYAREVLAERLARAGGHITLLVATHVDFDHVGGLVSLIARLDDTVTIDEVWYNAWPQISAAPDDTLGAVQGEMLSAALTARGLVANERFGGAAVAVAPGAAADELPTVEIEGGLQLTVLSPTTDALAKLRPKWRKEVEAESMTPGSFEDGLAKLRERERLPDDVLGEEEPDVEALADTPLDEDPSLANWSSIALLARYGDLSCLLAADAPAGALVGPVGALRGDAAKLTVGATKLSHHGSKGSTSVELLELLDCPRYLVSTNGAYYGHPSPEGVARVIVNGGERPHLYFNHRAPNALPFDLRRLKRRHGYETTFPEEGAEGLVVPL